MLLQGDAQTVLSTLPSQSVHCCLTSPPYWHLRDYKMAGQLGLEASWQDYMAHLMAVFTQVQRVLRDDGTCWVVIGDSYGRSNQGFSGTKHGRIGRKAAAFLPRPPTKAPLFVPPKSLCLIPFRFAIAMIEHGWILRNTIIWHKPNALPNSVTDRFTIDFEYLFFFTKRPHYWFTQQFEPSQDRSLHVQTPCNDGRRRVTRKETKRETRPHPRNKRCVWSINTQGFHGDHFAAFPSKLLETPLIAGCPEGGVVLDPFIGAGTTALVASKLNRRYIGIDLNPGYLQLTKHRLQAYANSVARRKKC